MAEWMTVKQVARYLQISEDKIYDMAKQGEFPAIKIRQQWRFDRHSIDEWMETLSNTAANARREMRSASR